MSPQAESEDAVSAFASMAAIRMRRQLLAAAHASVFPMTNPSPRHDLARCLAAGRHCPADRGHPTRVGRHLARRPPYKKAGVVLLDLVQAPRRDGLFDQRDAPDSLTSMRP